MRLRVIVFAVVAIAVAVGLVLPSAGAGPPKPPKPVKPVKPGQSFSMACPSGYTAGGGTVEWYDKKNQLLGTSPGTVVGTSTVMFGPAPKDTVTAVVTELNCQPPTTITTAEPTTTSTTTTTTIAPTTTSTTTTTTIAPTTTSTTTTTTIAPTTTSSTTTSSTTTTTTIGPNPTIHLTGSFTYPTDGEPRFIYGGDASLHFPVCEAGTSLDLDASVINLPADVTLLNFLDSEIPSLIIEIPYVDPTGNGDYETRTITYDFACVRA
jgi:hypothetical protein